MISYFQVLQILQSWTIGGLAETFTTTNKTAKDAWHELIEIYEGKDAEGMNIKIAHDKIKKARFNRPRPNFSFDDYCNIHIINNNILDAYEANVDVKIQI
jgi:hypothetical protein